MDTTTTGLLSALTTRLDSIDQSAVLRAAAIAVPVALVSLPLMTIGRMGSKFIDAKRTENALIAAGVPHETEFWHPVWGIGELMAKMSVSKVMAFLTERHGGAVIFRGLHKTSLLVTDPKIAQLIIGKYNLPKGDYSSVEGLLGNSMLTTNGAEWSHKRKAVNPAFRVSFLQNILLPITVDRTGEMFDVMFPNSPAGGSVNLQDLFSKITLDVIGLAGFEYDFGFSKSAQGTDNLSEVILGVLEEPNLRQFDPLRPYYKLRESIAYSRNLKAFHAMARTVISVARDRMAHAGSGNAGTAEVSPTSILGLLLQNQELSDTELQNEIALFLFAGHETSASTLTFIMILLHRHPLCKARVRQEVDEVLGEDGKPTFEDLGKLRYTNAVMKEALRLFPIGWATVRETVEPTKLGEYMIPAKTQVMVDFLHMHRNPALFDRPTEFLPERWLTQTTTDVDNGVSETVDASSTGTVPYSYLPFSGGMRSCIGKPFAEIEIKLVTAMLIQRYDFHVEEPKSWEGVDVCDLYKDGTTLRPLPHTVWITPRR